MKMSTSSDTMSFDSDSSSSVGCPAPGVSSESSPSDHFEVDNDDDEDDSMTETNSISSTPSEDDSRSPTIYKNNDSDNEYDTDNSGQDFKIKDWLKLAKVVINKNKSISNKHKLMEKYDEIQEFFYFFALEYFSTDQDLTEFVNNKKDEFVLTWEGTLGPCEDVFDLLTEMMRDINVANSLRQQ